MKAENTEAYLKTKTICSGRKYLLVIRMNGAVKSAVGRLKLRSHTENTAGWLTNNTLTNTDILQIENIIFSQTDASVLLFSCILLHKQG